MAREEFDKVERNEWGEQDVLRCYTGASCERVQGYSLA